MRANLSSMTVARHLCSCATSSGVSVNLGRLVGTSSSGLASSTPRLHTRPSVRVIVHVIVHVVIAVFLIARHNLFPDLRIDELRGVPLPHSVLLPFKLCRERHAPKCRCVPLVVAQERPLHLDIAREPEARARVVVLVKCVRE